MTTLIVGIDVSQARHDVSAMPVPVMVVDRHRRFANEQAGFADLEDWLGEVLGTGEYDTLQIGGEATGLHWFHTFWRLQNSMRSAG
jgi:transposase